MKKLSMVMSLILAAAVMSSCEQFKGMTSKNDEQKVDELAKQVADKLTMQAQQEQQKEQEIEAEVQKRMAAQQQQQPKVTERVVVKEVAAPSAEPTASRASGYIALYTDGQLSGRSMRLSFGQNVNTTDGGGFKDNISSAEYSIPSGWQVALYEDSGYSKKRYVIKSGTGTVEHLPPYMNDKISSVRWEKAGQ